MGLVLDIVPNHMGVHADNGIWFNVLEFGKLSPYARFFDINWDHAMNPVRAPASRRASFRYGNSQCVQERLCTFDTLFF